MVLIKTGVHSTGYRATHQDRHRRQDSLRLLRRLGLLLPPPSNCARCRPEMAKRNTGSGFIFQIIHRLPWFLVKLAEPRYLPVKFHDPVPRNWSFVSDAVA
jgi:hypothetical protein